MRNIMLVAGLCISLLDPAWGSTSKYGVVISQFIDRRVVIVYAHEYSKPDIFDMVLENTT